MVDFIDHHRDEYGVQPICRKCEIAPSVYYERKAQERDPSRRCKRAQRDDQLCEEITRLWEENFRVYGARKVWHQLKREGIRVARCTVERLMRMLGLEGTVRGKTKITTRSDSTAVKPPDLVNREFHATRPNELWISDFTYVATWRGFAYTVFVIDIFARMIVGWRVSSSMTTDLPLGALEQALHDRQVDEPLVHHSDQGSQYLSTRYTERLAEVGIAPSVGSCGDSYDNAMAESIIGPYKTEVIRRHGPWKSINAARIATLHWVDWYNNRRLLEPIGYRTPREAEMEYYQQQTRLAEVAELTHRARLAEGKRAHTNLSGETGAVHGGRSPAEYRQEVLEAA